MEKKLWLLYCDIIDHAFRDKDEDTILKYKKVFIEVSNRELKSKNGDYDCRQKKIRIFNLSRDSKDCLRTSIHELAHHIDHVNRGESDHSDEFYAVYKELIKAAIEMKLVTKEQILSLERNSSDLNKLQKIVKELNIDDYEDYKADKKMIQVKNCFSIKDKIKQNQYSWNGTSKLWEKEVDINNLDAELEELYALIDKANVNVIDANVINFDCFSYILVKDSYEFKDQLKARGYYYDSKKKGWKKKFKNEEIKVETEYITQLGLSNIKIVS